MIVDLDSQYEGLSTREGFNTSLRHFKKVNAFIGDLEDQINLADLLNDAMTSKQVQPPQIKPILNALLVDKYGYQYYSFNPHDNIEEFGHIAEETGKWTQVDMVLSYYSPELGLSLVNPKNPEHWEALRIIKKFELVTLYCGAFSSPGTKKKLYQDAMLKLIDLLNGKKFKTPAVFTGGSIRQEKPVPEAPPPVEREERERPRTAATSQKPAFMASAAAAAAKEAETASAPAAQPQAAAPPAKGRMTPLYGIPVTNELFHNGNVEAWKKIIESFTASHAGLRVFVFYDGEPIHDLNTLFKWGKVKRGTSIMISVAGDEIRDVAKLQKYLRQGASHLFEAFLKGHPHKVLNLF